MKLLPTRSALAILAVLELSALLHGQSLTRPRTYEGMITLPSRPVAPTGSLEGVVISDDTGMPVVGATVTLALAGPSVSVYAVLSNGSLPAIAPVRTDERGRFSFPALDAADYFLEARMAGYVSRMLGQPTNDGQRKRLSLGSGQHLNSVSLRLPRSAGIVGNIRDKAGQPAGMVAIELMQWDSVRVQPILSAQTRSAVDGSYRLDGFLPGEYILIAGSPPNFPGAEPGGTFATRVTVPSTDAVALNVALEAGTGYSVRGRVDARVLPAEVKWTVSVLVPRGGSRTLAPESVSRFEYNPRNGDFVLPGIHPGIYRINAQHLPDTCGGVDVMVFGADVNGLALRLESCGQ